MGVEVEYDAPRGQRYLRRWVIHLTCMEAPTEDSPMLWWVPKLRRWMPYPEWQAHPNPGNASSSCDMRSLKAAIRHMRRHPELGRRRMTLATRMRDSDMYLTRKEVGCQPTHGEKLTA